jgi:hypothetical protein
MQVAVGKDVEAVCRKCGEVWHVMVAVDDGKITRVQCKECMAYHRYRAPEGEERVDGVPKARRRTAASTPTSGGTDTKAKKVAKKKTSRKKGAKKVGAYDEPLLEPDLSRPIRVYKMTDTYSPGDRVEHAKFGQGVVEMLPGDGKMNVFFENGRKTLAHAR